jgi:hypothetical protein
VCDGCGCIAKIVRHFRPEKFHDYRDKGIVVDRVTHDEGQFSLQTGHGCNWRLVRSNESSELHHGRYFPPWELCEVAFQSQDCVHSGEAVALDIRSAVAVIVAHFAPTQSAQQRFDVVEIVSDVPGYAALEHAHGLAGVLRVRKCRDEIV